MKSRELLAITCVVAVLGLVGCARGPEATVENFYTAVGKGDIEQARSYLSGEILQMLPPAKITEGLKDEHEKVLACGGIKDIKVNLEGEGDVRSGNVTVSYRGDCPDETEGVKVGRGEDGWKLQVSK